MKENRHISSIVKSNHRQKMVFIGDQLAAVC